MCYTSPYIRGLRKLLKMKTHTGEGSSLCQAIVMAGMFLGLHNPTELMLIESSLSDKDAVWSFWQALIGELQRRTLRFWIKALS